MNGGCRLLMSVSQVDLLQKVLLFGLVAKVVDCLLLHVDQPVCQMLGNGSRQNGTVCGTSELESSARRRAHEPSETRVDGDGEVGFPSLAEVANLQGMNTGGSKCYLTDSASLLSSYRGELGSNDPICQVG